MSYEHVPESAKHILDVVFGWITVSVIMGWIANTTAILSLVWVVLRIYETRTVQGWFGKKRRATDYGQED